MLLVTEPQRPTGLHFLEKLTRENHAGAQATLADMLDRGRFVKPDRPRALALSRMAVENASAADAVWIGDVYQRVYCGTNVDDRQRSEGFVATWRRTFQQQRSAVEQPSRLGRAPDVALTRTCSNGERLDLPRRQANSGVMAAPLQVPTGPVVNGLVPSGVRSESPRR
jgi:TPR repeat protein